MAEEYKRVEGLTIEELAAQAAGLLPDRVEMRHRRRRRRGFRRFVTVAPVVPVVPVSDGDIVIAFEDDAPFGDGGFTLDN